MKFHEMDSIVTLREQTVSHAGPVVLINKFNVADGEADALLAAWSADAAIMKRQPGLSRRSYTAELKAAARSSTTLFGNPQPPFAEHSNSRSSR